MPFLHHLFLAIVCQYDVICKTGTTQHTKITPKEDKADQAIAIGNMERKFGDDWTCGCGDMLANGQTETQIAQRKDMLTTIFCFHTRGGAIT